MTLSGDVLHGREQVGAFSAEPGPRRVRVRQVRGVLRRATYAGRLGETGDDSVGAGRGVLVVIEQAVQGSLALLVRIVM